MKKISKSFLFSFVLFFIFIYIFQFLAPNIQSLLIYPFASSIICSLIVFHLTNSTLVTCISMLVNNLFLVFIVIPLSSGVTYYHDTLQFVLSSKNSHDLVKYLEVFAAMSLLITFATTIVYRLIARHRSKDVFISHRTWKREFLS